MSFFFVFVIFFFPHRRILHFFVLGMICSSSSFSPPPFAVYPDGKVCISILHAPGEDKHNEFESATERWRPIIGIESILVSVVSMLSSPNINSPANIDASKLFRDDMKQFKRQVRRTVQRSMEEWACVCSVNDKKKIHQKIITSYKFRF